LPYLSILNPRLKTITAINNNKINNIITVIKIIKKLNRRKKKGKKNEAERLRNNILYSEGRRSGNIINKKAVEGIRRLPKKRE